MSRSILKSIPSRRCLQRRLPWISACLALLVCPAMATAQEAQNAASAVSAPSITASSIAESSVTASSITAVKSPFDELNSRLADAAERLAAAPVFNPSKPTTSLPGTPDSASAARVRAIGAGIGDGTPEKIAPAGDAIALGPQRRGQTARVERLRPVIDPILRDHGIPAELVAVALVESGGRAAAISPKGARGVWQLMPATARRYGLIVSGQRDDRLDLVSATQAAARYLRDLHGLFGDWELVLAAYNAGEGAVQNAIQRAGSNSFAVLSQLRLLPLETRMYVPAVLAARGAFAPLNEARANKIQKPTSRSVVFALIASNAQLAAEGNQKH